MKKIIYILSLISLSNVVFAQMQKIIYNDSFVKSNHQVSIYDKYAFIHLSKKSVDDEAGVIYRFVNKKWKKFQYIDNIYAIGINLFVIQNCGYLYKNNFFTYAYDELNDNVTDVIVCWENNGIKFKKEYLIYPDTNSSVLNMVVKNDWMFYNTYTLNLIKKEYKYDDYFYHYENDKWVRKQRFRYIKDLNYYQQYFNSASIKYAMSENYLIQSNTGFIKIYRKNGYNWFLDKTMEPSDLKTYSDGHTLSVTNLGLSQNEKWLVINGTYRGNDSKYRSIIVIFKNDNDNWISKQIIKKPDSIKNVWGKYMNITNDELLFSDTRKRNNKGLINYYTLKNEQWIKKSEIFPPIQDTCYYRFGISIDRYKETVITSATYQPWHKCFPISYIFQIPARDTLRVGICEGESYAFNDTVIYDTGHYTDTLLASYGVDSVVQLYLTVYPKEQIEIDTVLCDGQQLIVGDSVLTEDGIYTITLQNQYGCDSIVTAKIEYDDIEVVESITADYGCQNGEIKLSVEGNNPPYAFDWSGGQTGGYISGLSYGKYDVIITGHSGCVYDYEYEVGDSIPYLIPNAFFPNGQEELNVIFKPYTAKDVHILSTEIYDRWGEKVFSGGADEFWDGTYKGKMQSPGVYLYRIVIDTPCGEEVKAGQVVVLR